MLRCLLSLLVAFLLLPAVPQGVAAQTVVRRDVVANGALRSETLVLRLRGTVGQTAIGRSVHSAVDGRAGFWYVLRPDTLVTTDVRDGPSPAPTAHLLTQNLPNPFSASTRIRFELPRREPVTLQVLDVLGRRVSVLIDGVLDPGVYFVEVLPEGWANGLYFYRLATPSFTAVRKLLFLR